ncbi:MAG: PAS domain S-box protein [Bacteroidota bacterium]
MSEAVNSGYWFFEGGGEMGRMIRGKDWEQTPLGSPALWPESLRTMVSMMLNNPFGIYIAWGPEYVALYNDGYRPILGAELHPGALGTPTSITFPNIWPDVKPLYDEVMQGKSHRLPDYKLVLIRSGFPEECVFDLAYSPIRMENGEVGGVLVTVAETTSKEKAINALKESEERFRVMAENSDMLIAMSDATSNANYFNLAWANFTGRSVLTLLDFGWADLIHEEDRQDFVDLYIDAFSKKQNWVGQFRMLNHQNEYRWLLANGAARFTGDGTFSGYVSSSVDITDQVAARKQVEETEEKLRLAINSAELGFYEVYYDSELMTTDERFREMWGMPFNSVNRSEYALYIHPDDQAHRQLAHQESVSTGQLDYQTRVIWPDGSHHYIRVTGKVVYENGNPVKLIGMIQDITEAEFARIRVEESERTMRSMVLEAPVAMCILRGPQHIVEIANDRILEIWGKRRSEVGGKPIFEGLHEARGQGLEGLLSGVYNTGESVEAFERPISLPRNNKLETAYVNFVYHAMGSTNEQTHDILVLAIDVTPQVLARREIEQIVNERTVELANSNQELQRSNAELAQFAYIASHDLQEPLRKISNFSQMLERNLGGEVSETARNFLDKIQNSALRMTRLIKDVLSYSELVRESGMFAPTDLNEILDGIRADYELLLEQKNAVIIADKLPVIEAIPLQMSQLLGNLLGNALKFVRPGVAPEIRITVNTLAQQEQLDLGFPAEPEYVHIQLRDNGIGLEDEYAEQIFHIFQRLHKKTDYEGTGIGLAMCKKIALNHNGDINALGSTTDGAVMNVYLPVKAIKS